MLALPRVKKLVNGVGVPKSIGQARSIAIKKNPIRPRVFVVSMECRDTYVRSILGRISLPLFVEAHATRVTLKAEDQKKVDYLTKSLSSYKYLTNRAT